MREKGIIFIVSGPSGCGKTTLCRRLLKKGLGLKRSLSITTRPLRRGERRGRDYIYITEQEFKKRVKQGAFLEHARVFGNYYGTPKEPVYDALEKRRDILLNIDVQGAAQIRAALKAAVLIFILPPSFGDLERRLLKRSSDTAAQIRKRLRIAYRETRSLKIYNYAIINDNIKDATEKLTAIVRAERCKIRAGLFKQVSDTCLD